MSIFKKSLHRYWLPKSYSFFAVPELFKNFTKTRLKIEFSQKLFENFRIFRKNL